MIVWAPQQYAPPHDHPSGGCMVKVARGPGIKETLWEKKPSGSPTPTVHKQQHFCCEHRNTSDHSHNSYGCTTKGHSTEMLQELYTFLARIGNEDEVKTLIGDKIMHEVWNPFAEPSYALSYYLGDFSHIAFWMPDNPAHGPLCLSRGDDELAGAALHAGVSTRRGRRGTIAKIKVPEGCHDCAP